MASYISREAYSGSFHKAIIEGMEAVDPNDWPKYLWARIGAEIGLIVNAPLALIEFILRKVLVLVLEVLRIVAYPFLVWGLDLESFNRTWAAPLFNSLHKGAEEAVYIFRDSVCLAIDNLWVSDLWNEAAPETGLYGYFYREEPAEG